MSDDMRKNLFEETTSRIAEHGWTALGIGADEDQASFTYSVGFQQTFNHPEVVLIGFDPRLSYQIIAGIAESLKRKDLHLPRSGGLATGVIQKFDVLVRPVPEPYATNMARAAAARVAPGDLRVLQICLPDAEGRQVDDPDCLEKFKTVQDFTQFEE